MFDAFDRALRAGYGEEALDDPRTVNDVASLLDSTALFDRTIALPRGYEIAVSSACDIRCLFCPRQTFPPDEVHSGLMTGPSFTPLTPGFEAAQRVNLLGLGEPFLNPRLFDFITAAKSRGVSVATSTHGLRLTGRGIARVLASGLDELGVSIDGADAETFAALRGGSELATVSANVRELVRRRHAAGRRTPLVFVACAVSRRNVDQMPALVRLAHRLGADRVAFANVVLDDPRQRRDSVVDSDRFRDAWDRAREEAGRCGVECVFYRKRPLPWLAAPAPPRPPRSRWRCAVAWQRMSVEHDGNLRLCGYLDHSLGNSRDGGVADRFCSGTASGIRRRIMEGDLPEACRGCDHLEVVTGTETVALLDRAEEKIRSCRLSPAVRTRLESELDRFRTELEAIGG